MSDFLDILIKVLVPLIPSCLAWISAKSTVLNKIEADNKIIRDQMGDISKEVAFLRKDVFRMQVQNDAHDSSILKLSGMVLQTNKSVESIKKDSEEIKSITEKQKALEESYGKIIRILDKIIKKSKQG